MDHGFDLAAIRELLGRETFEEDYENPGVDVRRVYLGTIFSLSPSGKFYTPFACSNVDACPTCEGSGVTIDRRYKRRTQKKHAARQAITMRRYEKRWGAPSGLYGRALTPREARAKAWLNRQPKAFRMRSFSAGATCTACAGCGSREAHLDEIWRESTEQAFESVGLHLVSGESDPCDLFAAEYRAPGDDDDDDDGKGFEDDDLDSIPASD